MVKRQAEPETEWGRFFFMGWLGFQLAFDGLDPIRVIAILSYDKSLFSSGGPAKNQASGEFSLEIRHRELVSGWLMVEHRGIEDAI